MSILSRRNIRFEFVDGGTAGCPALFTCQKLRQYQENQDKYH